MIEPPLDFDATTYRSLYPDLTHLNDRLIQAHYERYGKEEGRRAHTLANRNEFAQLLSAERALEIGPFTRPLLSGPKVSYADIYSTEQLQEMAPGIGLDATGVPNIQWVVSPGDLGAIDEKFDAVLTSHVIEHQPNLVGHLSQVSGLLNEGGRYLVLAPDYRYCFDHFMKPSTISEVLDAHVRKLAMHDPRSLIASRLLLAHNDAVRHWGGDHGDVNINPAFPDRDRTTRLKLAVNQAVDTPETLLNEHAWFFTADTFTEIMSDLLALELMDLEVERLYPSMRNTIEFWAILRKK
jgi:SAM-dependent methyltransferase